MFGKKHDVYTSFEGIPPSFFLLFFSVQKVWGKVSFEVVSSPHNQFPSTTLFPKPSRYIHTGTYYIIWNTGSIPTVGMLHFHKKSTKRAQKRKKNINKKEKKSREQRQSRRVHTPAQAGTPGTAPWMERVQQSKQPLGQIMQPK